MFGQKRKDCERFTRYHSGGIVAGRKKKQKRVVAKEWGIVVNV